jgi:NitT/TauT family transport system substrate-binding protein
VDHALAQGQNAFRLATKHATACSTSVPEEKMRIRRNLMTFTLIALLAFMFAAPTAVTANDRVKMKVAFSSYLDFLLDAYIAIEKGYFEEQGLDFEPVFIASGVTIMNIFSAGQVDGAFLPSSTSLIMADKGVKLKMVCGIGNRRFQYMVLQDSSIKTIKDFDGKTIANVAKSSNPYVCLEYDMKQNGVQGKTFTTKTHAERTSMLLGKKVDVILGGPYQTAVLGDEVRLVHECSTSKYLWNSCGWCFTPEYIKAHPEAVQKFVNALAKARTLILKNEPEAIKIFTKYNKLELDKFKKPYPLPEFDSPPIVYTYGFQRTYELMKDAGILKNDIDTKQLVDGSFAKSLDTDY